MSAARFIVGLFSFATIVVVIPESGASTETEFTELSFSLSEIRHLERALRNTRISQDQIADVFRSEIRIFEPADQLTFSCIQFLFVMTDGRQSAALGCLGVSAQPAEDVLGDPVVLVQSGHRRDPGPLNLGAGSLPRG